MTARHTPGPWHVTAFVREPDGSSPTGRRARIVSECESADGYLVSAANASICDVARRAGLADARLIAAAPEMVECLRGLVRCVAPAGPDAGEAREVETARALLSRIGGGS